MTGFDAIAYKKTTLGQWNAVADRWNAWGSLLDSWLGPVSETLLDMAQIGPGSRVLHVAGGPDVWWALQADAATCRGTAPSNGAALSAGRLGPEIGALIRDFVARIDARGA